MCTTPGASCVSAEAGSSLFRQVKMLSLQASRFGSFGPQKGGIQKYIRPKEPTLYNTTPTLAPPTHYAEAIDMNTLFLIYGRYPYAESMLALEKKHATRIRTIASLAYAAPPHGSETHAQREPWMPLDPPSDDMKRAHLQYTESARRTADTALQTLASTVEDPAGGRVHYPNPACPEYLKSSLGLLPPPSDHVAAGNEATSVAFSTLFAVTSRAHGRPHHH